jgi:dimethylaniline monooxygenase (N-oxide forming)
MNRETGSDYIGIKDLSFNGYNGAMYSGLTSEVTSLWIAAYLEGNVLSLPTEEQQARGALERFKWLDQRDPGKTSHGTNTVPFSLRPIDDLLEDLDLNISSVSRFLQWISPVDPSAYRFLGSDLRKRIASKRSDQPGLIIR